MHKLIWKSLFVSPALVGVAFLGSDAVAAFESQFNPETAKLEIATDVQQKLQPLAIKAAPKTPEVVESEPVFSATELTKAEQTAKAPAKELVAQAQPATPEQDNQMLQQIQNYGNEGNGNSLNQVTNVNQLRDVSPGDWAYEALRNLVETYGCIAGYPDGTYRGNRAMTRYEFAAGLNACLQQIERLIAAATADFVTKEDLAVLQRLMEEFEAELATLGTRVDNLEGRVAFLEDHQFSTTTKLVGEAIFAATVQGGDDIDDDQLVFGNRVRLVLDTSFTGTDSLITRLAMGNLEAFNDPDGSFEGTQTFNLGEDGNNVILDWLAYYTTAELPLVGEVEGYIAATGGIHSDYVPTLNPYFEDFDGGNGAISTFATESPIYRIGGGAGIAGSFKFGLLESVLGPSTITAGYLASEASDPADGAGLFNGDYAALGQINFNVSDAFAVAFTYVHAYHGAGSAIFGAGSDTGLVGTLPANLRDGDIFNGAVINAGDGKVTNSYGGEVTWRIGDAVNFSGYFAYTDVIVINEDDAEIWTFGGGFAFPDFLKEGNVLGIFGGVQPYLGGVDAVGRPDMPVHIEAFYKYQVSDNISITPGVIWQMNSNQDDDNDDSVIGTLRTTFTF